MEGAVAQSVEQRTENPCVGGSIPPHTTAKRSQKCGLFYAQSPTSQSSCQLFIHLQLLYFRIDIGLVIAIGRKTGNLPTVIPCKSQLHIVNFEMKEIFLFGKNLLWVQIGPFY